MIYAKFKADAIKAGEVKDFFKAREIQDPDHPYDYFLVRYKGVGVHAYRNRKEIYTIVFSGEDEEALSLAHLFSKNVTVSETSEEKKKKKENYFQSWEDLSDQIGSDEVGVGDFFGPLVVVASFVNGKDIPLLEQYRINDSKKRNDDYILSLGAKLRKKRKSYSILVSPSKLSMLASNGFNIHKTRAKCHNLCHIGLRKKYLLSPETMIYVDQFTPEKDYRRLVGEERVSNPIVFQTKGESFYPSVALSSVLARYLFLREWKKREEKFHVLIPKGASSLVDKTYGRLVNKYGKEALDPFVKRYFRNYTSK